MISLESLKARRKTRTVTVQLGGEPAEFEIGRLRIGELMRAKRLFGQDGHPLDEGEAGRALLRAGVIDPALDDAALDVIEQDWEGYNELLSHVCEFNGMGRAAADAARTFRTGGGEPGPVPEGS